MGYSRAVRVGGVVHVSGTTATDETGAVVGRATPTRRPCRPSATSSARSAARARACEDVVRTRMYVVDIERDWQAVGRAHGEVFGTIRPATSMVEVRRLIDPAMLVEIEAEAIGSARGRRVAG